MLPALLTLIELQGLDILIKHDKEQVQRLPLELAALEKLKLTKKTEVLDVEGKIRQTELERRRLELEEKGHRERISKLRTQQMLTRKNEEYQALEAEISAAQQAITRCEDVQLELLELLERQNEELKLAHQRLELSVQKISTQAGEARARAEVASERLSKNQLAADKLRKKLNPDLLAIYDRLVSGGKTNAVVPLSNGKVCSGCHMNVIHQTALDARSRDKVAICENCGRILYDPDISAANK